MQAQILPQVSQSQHPSIGKFTLYGKYIHPHALDGLPNVLREHLVSEGAGEAALLVDALRYCGWQAHKKFTFQSVISALKAHGLTLAEGLVRRALKHKLVFWQTKFEDVRGKHRPEVRYIFPDLLQLMCNLCPGKRSATDQFTAEDLMSMKTYRGAMHRELIRRRPGVYSRAMLAARLGVTARTTRNYDRIQGIIATARTFITNLRSVLDWQELVAGAERGRQWLVLRFKNGQVRQCPAILGIALHWMARGDCEVLLETQLANSYKLAEI